MFVENIVSQMLVSSGHRLYFYSNISKDDVNKRMEIDFLISKSNITSRHNIIPIEVKSGKNYTITSLKKCIRQYAEYVTTHLVLHSGDVKVADGITYLPLYMTELL